MAPWGPGTPAPALDMHISSASSLSHLTLPLAMTTALPWCSSPSVQVLWRRGLQRLEQKPVPRLQRPRAPGLRRALHLLHQEHGNHVGDGCGVTQFSKHCSLSLPKGSRHWEWAGGGSQGCVFLSPGALTAGSCMGLTQALGL